MTTYLVGVDPSEHALTALRWARTMAASDDAIIALHVQEGPVAAGLEPGAFVDPAEAAPSTDEVASILARDDDPRVEGRRAEGPTGRAIVEAAEGIDTDLVVVVGHGGSGKASLLLGSTAHHVVHHAAAPVVVVRGEVRLPVERLVVGIDGFDENEVPDERSMAALRWALRVPGVSQVGVWHADFVPAVAAGPVREPGLESDDERDEDDASLRRAIDQATDGTGAAPNGATVVPVVAAGTGAFALIEASRDADLIVIGTRGRSGLVELIVGSTTLEVLAHAHCPVAVVH